MEGLAMSNSNPQWLITADHVEEDRRHVGFCSDGWTDTLEAPHKFRMFDDDGNLYYEGKSNEQSFAPLDRFGSPNAGATEIHYEVGDDYVKL
jgi:hypothetical protein